jgi:hypothetical protein
MKNLFYFNAFVFAFLAVLFFQPMIGLLLMIPVGLCQVITTIHLLISSSKYDEKWKPYLLFHLLASLIVVITLFESTLASEYLILSLLISSLILSIYFMIILYLIYITNIKNSPQKI